MGVLLPAGPRKCRSSGRSACLDDRVALVAVVGLRPSPPNDKRTESTARPRTCEPTARQEQHTSCEPSAGTNRAAKLCDFVGCLHRKQFQECAVFVWEPSVATNRAAKLCDFSGVNIEDSFRKALIFDIPVKKVSAQFQNTPRTRN